MDRQNFIILFCTIFIISAKSLNAKFITSEVATYEEVKDLPNHPEVILIDVRERDKVAKTGSIPTAINIPLGEVEDALNLSPTEFKAKFGRDLQSKEEQNLIFHCSSGGRAERGAQFALALGYKNVKNYKGSWMEWSRKQLEGA